MTVRCWFRFGNLTPQRVNMKAMTRVNAMSRRGSKPQHTFHSTQWFPLSYADPHQRLFTAYTRFGETMDFSDVASNIITTFFKNFCNNCGQGGIDEVGSHWFTKRVVPNSSPAVWTSCPNSPPTVRQCTFSPSSMPERVLPRTNPEDDHSDCVSFAWSQVIFCCPSLLTKSPATVRCKMILPTNPYHRVLRVTLTKFNWSTVTMVPKCQRYFPILENIAKFGSHFLMTKIMNIFVISYERRVPATGTPVSWFVCCAFKTRETCIFKTNHRQFKAEWLLFNAKWRRVFQTIACQTLENSRITPLSKKCKHTIATSVST